MASEKISQLTPGNPAQTGDLLPIDRSGTNYSLTAGSIAALATTQNLFSLYASLPNVKFIPLYQTLTSGSSGYVDTNYTVPTNRRAIFSSLQFAVSPNGYSLAGALFIPLVKVSSNYYGIGATISALLAGQTYASTTPPPYIAEAGESLSVLVGSGSTTTTPSSSVISSVSAPVTTTLTLTAASAPTAAGYTVYTGTITGGGANAFATGYTFVVTGFTNAGNNGTFACVGSTSTELLLQNQGSTAETHAGSAATKNASYNCSANQFISSLNIVGEQVTITGCTHSADNGTFTAVAGGGNSGAITLGNANAVAETSVLGSAFLTITNIVFTIKGWVVEFDNTASIRSAKLLGPSLTPYSATPSTLYTPAGATKGLLVGSDFMGTQASAGSIFGTGACQSGNCKLYYGRSSSSESASLTAAATAIAGDTLYTGTIPYGAGVNYPVTAITAPPAAFTVSTVVSLNNPQGYPSTPTAYATYTGTFTGLTPSFAGGPVTFSGFSNSANNGTFIMVSASPTRIVIYNPNAVVETTSATTTVNCSVLTGTFSATNDLLDGMYVNVSGFATAGNNGTFLCYQSLSGSLLIGNSGSTTATANAFAITEPLYGQSVVVSGFANSGNNGTFTVAHSTATTLLLVNSGGTAETHAGSATIPIPPINHVDYITEILTNGPFFTAADVGYNTVINNGESIQLWPVYSANVIPSNLAQSFNTMFWVNVVEF